MSNQEGKYPATPIARAADADIDGPFHYVDYGGEGRAPMVLLHGIGGTQLNWSRVAPTLAKDYHVLALDLVGFGLTPLAGRSATLEANTEVVARFISDVAGAPAVVVGHSMGGQIGILLAARRPELAAQLVLLDTTYYGRGFKSPVPGASAGVLDAISRSPAVGGRILALGSRMQGADRVVRDTFARLGGQLDTLPVDFVEAHIDQERERSKSGDAYVGYVQAWRSMRRLCKTADRHDDGTLQRISADTLVIHGRDDTIVPLASSERLCRVRPGWRLVVLDDVRHSPQIDAPEAFVDALRAGL